MLADARIYFLDNKALHARGEPPLFRARPGISITTRAAVAAARLLFTIQLLSFMRAPESFTPAGGFFFFSTSLLRAPGDCCARQRIFAPRCNVDTPRVFRARQVLRLMNTLLALIFFLLRIVLASRPLEGFARFECF